MAAEKRQPVYNLDAEAPGTGKVAQEPPTEPAGALWVRVTRGEYFVHPATRSRIDSRGRPLAAEERTNWLQVMIAQGLLETFSVHEQVDA